MNQNFEQQLIAARRQVVARIGSFNYNQEIYKNLSDPEVPTQLINEYAVSLMFYKHLITRGWACIYGPFGLGTQSSNKVNANEWYYTKNNRSVLIIFGDGLLMPLTSEPDLVITDSCKFFNFSNVLNLDPEIFGFHETILDTDYIDRAPTRTFNCFMAAPSSTRQCWLYTLYRYELLENGNVSYRIADRQDSTLDGNLDAKLKIFDRLKNDGINEMFSKEHQQLRTQVPIKNFNSSLEQAIIDSKVSVVVETEYNDPNQMFFTEKTFRALLMPRPYIIFTSGHKTGAISYLKSLGFETHDDLIDHSYDQEPDPGARIGMIVHQLLDLECLMYDPELMQILHQRAQKNMDLIKKFRSGIALKVQLALEKIDKIL